MKSSVLLNIEKGREKIEKNKRKKIKIGKILR